MFLKLNCLFLLFLSLQISKPSSNEWYNIQLPWPLVDLSINPWNIHWSWPSISSSLSYFNGLHILTPFSFYVGYIELVGVLGNFQCKFLKPNYFLFVSLQDSRPKPMSSVIFKFCHGHPLPFVPLEDFN
jgi:hypothetical protein